MHGQKEVEYDTSTLKSSIFLITKGHYKTRIPNFIVVFIGWIYNLVWQLIIGMPGWKHLDAEVSLSYLGGNLGTAHHETQAPYGRLCIHTTMRHTRHYEWCFGPAHARLPIRIGAHGQQIKSILCHGRNSMAHLLLLFRYRVAYTNLANQPDFCLTIHHFQLSTDSCLGQTTHRNSCLRTICIIDWRLRPSQFSNVR